VRPSGPFSTTGLRALLVGPCPQMDTSIQIAPTGKKLLPLTVVK
jgi:hypothetical protein